MCLFVDSNGDSDGDGGECQQNVNLISDIGMKAVVASFFSVSINSQNY